MHRRLREISSVVMTTSGFLSPSREGKLPESRLMPFPNFKATTSQASSSYSSTIPSEVKSEHPPQSRHKKLSNKTPNPVKEKGKNIVGSIINSNNKNEESKVKKLIGMKEPTKLKALKTGAIRESNQGPRLKKTPKIKDKSKLNLLNTIFDKPVQASSSKHSKNSISEEFSLSSSEKLTTEPDKQKLNIFKKISKVKEDKNNDSSAHHNSKSNNSITSKTNTTHTTPDNLIKPDIKLEVIEDKLLKPVLFKPTTEKKNDFARKTYVEKKHNETKPIKEPKQELSSNTSKKRKKKQKIPNDDEPPVLEPASTNIGTKKLKNKHDSDLFSSPSKFSFFGQFPAAPGLLPTGPSLLPPSLASNPLVPKYTAPNSVLPVLEKPSTITSMMYLPLPGEEDFDKSEFDELSSSLASEKEKASAEKVKVNNFDFIIFN